MAIVYLLNFCLLAMRFLFLVFFLHLSGSTFFWTGVISSFFVIDEKKQAVTTAKNSIAV